MSDDVRQMKCLEISLETRVVSCCGNGSSYLEVAVYTQLKMFVLIFHKMNALRSKPVHPFDLFNKLHPFLTYNIRFVSSAAYVFVPSSCMKPVNAALVMSKRYNFFITEPYSIAKEVTEND
jgi:hypothetical protein